MIKPRKSYNLISVIYFLIMITSIANASSNASVENSISVPSTLSKSEVQLVGEAQFSVLFWDIYQSRLYTKSGGFKEINSSVVFENHYQINIDKQQLIDKTIEQWQKMQIPTQNYQQYIPLLMTLWPDINSGDTLAITVGESSSYFYYNDQYIGMIKDKKFAELFLGIWLSPNTTHPAFRQKLIGVTP